MCCKWAWVHVHTSCGGTSNVTVLKSTTLTLSRQGRMKKSPGPLAFPDVKRPRRRITALSYSFTICVCVSARTYNCQPCLMRATSFTACKNYLNGNEQRKREEHYDHYKRNYGQHVAATSQAIFSRCRYFDVCRGKKDCAQPITHNRKKSNYNSCTITVSHLPPALPGVWRSSCSFWGAISPRDAIVRCFPTQQQQRSFARPTKKKRCVLI